MNNLQLTQDRDSAFRKVSSIILGMISGFFPGFVATATLVFIYLEEIKKVKLSGEALAGPAFNSFFIGIPLGCLGGAVLAYLTRNYKVSRVFFLISGIFWIYILAMMFLVG